MSENEESWTHLKMAVASPSLPFDSINRLSVFEFFSILRQRHSQNESKK